MTAASREQFAALVRTPPVDLALAALLVGAETEPDLDLAAADAALAALAADVPLGVAGEPASVSAARLAEVLHPYSGRRDDFAELRSSLLHEVIRRRRGLPILLAVLWVEVGRRAGIPVYPVGMPGHFLVGVGDPDGDHVLVDAFRGGLVVSLAEAERLAVDSTRHRPHPVPPAPHRPRRRAHAGAHQHPGVRSGAHLLGGQGSQGLTGRGDHTAMGGRIVAAAAPPPRRPAARTCRAAGAGRRISAGMTGFLCFADAVEGADPEAASAAR